MNDKRNPGIVMRFYRMERWLYLHGMKFLANIIFRLIYLVFNCYIAPTVDIGEDVSIAHGIGIVLHQNSVIGSGSTIYQNVTLGNANGPKIGKNCVLGAGCVILGDIVIGDNCRIGANAVVLKDVPDGATAVGVPARIILCEDE